MGASCATGPAAQDHLPGMGVAQWWVCHWSGCDTLVGLVLLPMVCPCYAFKWYVLYLLQCDNYSIHCHSA